MSIQDWAALTAAVTTLAGTVAFSIRWMVKHYLYELRPNGGGSVKDSIDRLERQVEEIYRILLTRNNS
jgi:hypothetical protein